MAQAKRFPVPSSRSTSLRRVFECGWRYLRGLRSGGPVRIREFRPVVRFRLAGTPVRIRWDVAAAYRVRLTPGGDFLPPRGEVLLRDVQEGQAARLTAWGIGGRIEAPPLMLRTTHSLRAMSPPSAVVVRPGSRAAAHTSLECWGALAIRVPSPPVSPLPSAAPPPPGELP